MGGVVQGVLAEVMVVVDVGRGRGGGYGVCNAVFVQGCAALMPLNMGMGSTDRGVTRPRGRAAVFDGGGRLSSRSMLRGNVGESNRPIPLDRGMGNFGQSETRQRDRASGGLVGSPILLLRVS